MVFIDSDKIIKLLDLRWNEMPPIPHPAISADAPNINCISLKPSKTEIEAEDNENPEMVRYMMVSKECMRPYYLRFEYKQMNEIKLQMRAYTRENPICDPVTIQNLINYDGINIRKTSNECHRIIDIGTYPLYPFTNVSEKTYNCAIYYALDILSQLYGSYDNKVVDENNKNMDIFCMKTKSGTTFIGIHWYGLWLIPDK